MEHSRPTRSLGAPSYDSLLAGSLQCVLIVRGRVVAHANAAAAALFGAKDAEDLVGRSLAVMLDLDAARDVMAVARRRTASDPLHLHTTGRASEGRKLHLELLALPVLWRDAQAVQVTILDHTRIVAARAALAERNEEFRHLIDGSLQGIYVHIDHRFQFVNQTFATIFGYRTTEEVVALGDVMAVYAPTERERLQGFYQARVSGGQPPVRYEFEGQRKDGTRIWLENLVRVVTWQGKRAILATVIDITERKRAERELLTSERRFRDLVEGSMQGILIVVPGGRIVFVNRALVDLFGYARPQELYTLDSVAALLADDDKERARIFSQDGDRGEMAPLRVLAHGLRKDGRELWLDTAVRPVRWGDDLAYQVTLVDVTERVHAERELRANQRLLETVLNTIPHALYVKDADLRYRMVNRAFSEAAQRPPESIVGRVMQDVGFNGSSALDAIEEADREVLRTGKPKLIEDLSIPQPDGGTAHRQIIKYPLFGESGRVEGVVGITEDTTQRMAALERVQASQSLVRMVFDRLPYIMFVKDAQGRYQLVNSKFAEFHLLSEEDIVGKTVEELPLGSEEDRAKMRDADAPVYAGESIDIPEVQLTAVHGETGIYHLQKLPLRDTHGSIIGLLGLAEDITERIEAQETVRESQRLLRTVIDTLPHSIYLRDREGRYRMVNRAMAAYHGETVDSLVGKTMRDFARTWTPELQELVDADRRVFAEGLPVEIPDVWLTSHDGAPTRRRVVKMPLFNDAGEATGIVGIAEDIEERKRAEEELNSSRMLLQTVINLLPLWVFVKDVHRHFLLINRKMAEDYALTAEVEPGERIDLITSITEEEKSVIYELDQRVLDSGQLVEVPEVQITLPNGETRLFRTVRIPLHDAAGTVAGIVGIAEDITERRRTENAIQQAQKLESLGVLAGGIAHDFNNLLVSILGNASLAIMDMPQDSPALEPVQQIETAGQRAAELCRQMLAYSGKSSFEIASVNLNLLIEEMTQLLRVSLARSIHLEYAFEPELPAVEIDPTQIRQVVMNLVMNAAEAIGLRNGSITLTTRVVDADAEYLRPYIQGEPLPVGRYVQLEVIDTGEGIPLDMVPRIFDPFFTTKFAGRGLGLAAVLGIVRGHKGAMQVVSEPGIGSTFRMLLPARGGPVPETESNEDDTLWRSDGMALIVDDQPDVLRVLGRMVSSLGFTVVEASNGTEALRRLREHGDAIRVAVLDVTMPEMDGLETLKQMQREQAGLPVVLLSGYSEQDLQSRFEEHGVRSFLQKPFTRRTLSARLQAALEQPTSVC